MRNSDETSLPWQLMRVVTWLSLSTALFGCATQDIISFDVPQATSTLTIVDERPDTEVNYESCRNHGLGMYGLRDEMFKARRIDVLRARLNAAFGNKIEKVVVAHFQNCFQDSSSTLASVAAPISLPLAIVLDAARKRPENLLMTYIDMTVDGERITVTDIRPLKRSLVWNPSSHNQETIGIIVQSTEHAISQSIEKINERLSSTQANTAR